ncbi:ribonuclease P protein component [uncultured Campylobacter sp.]|uniref:ribonuclease P protein component n=1 Tax=uncultured Campylobacter sp. TaxID=218934 RepID=UPI00262BC0B6|nr:ribonuclease P protein component [uncultured Campylobacter sp.]
MSTISDAFEFSELYKNANKWHCVGVIIFYLPCDEMKVAFVASKKVGKSVLRNRAKRLLRVVFSSLSDTLSVGKYAFVAKSDFKDLDYLTFKKNIIWGLKKLKCLDPCV